MKKVAAFILSLVYFAATVAGMGHVPDKASYAHVTSHIAGEFQKEQAEEASEQKTDLKENVSINCKLKKTAKHLAGKVKTPRPAGFSSLILPEAFPPIASTTIARRPWNEAPASPVALYIRHCVLIL